MPQTDRKNKKKMAHHDLAFRLPMLTMPADFYFPMALRAAIELKVFEIIAESGADAQLSPSQMVAKMSTSNPNAAAALERILRSLVANSFLTIQKGKEAQFAYGLTAQSRWLVPDKDGVSLAPFYLFLLQKPTVDTFYHLEATVLEGGPTPFKRTHGMEVFEYLAVDRNFGRIFHEAMSNAVATILDVVLEAYKGFDDLKEILDVGGGIGKAISKIIAKFPHIRGVNYDLDSVIAEAPQYPGVEHIAGNMFEAVPNAENIFMRGILDDYGEDQCMNLLKNCWKALPDNGKLITVEFVVPSPIEADHASRHTTGLDLLMMVSLIGAKERTATELDELSKAAGFTQKKVFPISHGITVLEFHKKLSS